MRGRMYVLMDGCMDAVNVGAAGAAIEREEGR